MSVAASPQRGEYRKIQELASGGMGSVELARVTSGPHSGGLVAVKRLHPHLEREKHFADMFFDEARITAGLHHPNVVEIFDWGQDKIGRYLALEYVPGDSLLGLIRDAKKANTPIPIELALFIVAKTAEGLHAAHELRNEQGDLRHLVHRDVTPSNILLGIDGQVKLIDFGVAKARDRLSHTSTGTIKGKFGYMSPEQARGFPIDRRSDVFSLGIVLWETLALRRLYRSESELEIMRMIVEDPPTPIRTIRREVPPAIEAVINAALAKNRDDRLGSCAEMAEFLWAAYHDAGFTAAEPELADFFRRVMPERFNAVELLLSGSSDHIEPSIRERGGSGSFSGAPRIPEEVSGAVPRPGATPNGGTPVASIATHSAPVPVMTTSGTPVPVEFTPYDTSASNPGASRRRSNLLIALAAGVGIVGIVGSIAVAMSGGRTATPGATHATTATPPPVTPPVTPGSAAQGNAVNNAGTTPTPGSTVAAGTASPGATPTQGANEPSLNNYATVRDPNNARPRGGRVRNGNAQGATRGATQASNNGGSASGASGSSSASQPSGASTASAPRETPPANPQPTPARQPAQNAGSQDPPSGTPGAPRLRQNW